jgi:hypothetical protein
MASQYPNSLVVLLAAMLPSCDSAHIAAQSAEQRPPASAGHALVYDDSLKAVLLVTAGLGGMTSPPPGTRSVLWRWDGRKWSVVDSSSPPIRNLGGVAYDSRRDVVVLFGGSYSLDRVYGDTWEWSPRTGWVQRPGPGPGGRDHVQMVYDPARSRVILVGGQVSLDSFPADIWTWEGSTWSQVDSGLRRDGSIVRSHTIRPGRGCCCSVARARLWGETSAIPGPGMVRGWTTAAPDVQPRTHAAIGWTPQGVILVGGLETALPVLRLSGSAWEEQSADRPGPRYLAAMAYDRARGVTVLFGGGDPRNDQLFADTWEHSPATGWRLIR